jgi:hypothetical protein
VRDIRVWSIAILLICILCVPALLSAQGSNPDPTPTMGVLTMTITVGDKTFIARMLDIETTRALLAQLPMTLNMSELNAKEKYYQLPKDLPAGRTESPATIHAGEIMVWSSNTLVLFYSTFANTYGGYVRLGRIEETFALASALGPGSVQVTFSIDD